jgi:hypothetical protein
MDPSGLVFFECEGNCEGNSGLGDTATGTHPTRGRTYKPSPARQQQRRNKAVGASTLGSEIKKPVTVNQTAKRIGGVEYDQLDPFQQSWALEYTWCHNNPKACNRAWKEGLKTSADKIGNVLLDVIGVTDATECAQGSFSGCVWTAVGLIPGGKIAKAAKLLKYVDDVGDGRRLLGACMHSFDPDTPVLMADGTHKRIKDIKTGDEVVAADPETGKTGSQKVTQLHTTRTPTWSTSPSAPATAPQPPSTPPAVTRSGAIARTSGSTRRNSRPPTNYALSAATTPSLSKPSGPTPAID